MAMIVAMMMCMLEDACVGEHLKDLWEELLCESHDGLKTYHYTARQQDARYSESAKRFDLAVAQGKSRSGWAKRVGYSSECRNVRDHVRQRV